MGHNLRPPGVKSGIIPCKVPLGEKFSAYLPGNKTFTPAQLLKQLSIKGHEVGLVIDLTNSWRYYDPDEFDLSQRRHMKIQCRGRGEVPEPEAVNRFCFEVLKFKRNEEAAAKDDPVYRPQQIVVHCTHGFNRTGYMIASWMIRHEGMSVSKAIQTFAGFRGPGIYKDDYIQELFKYNHENRAGSTPAVPSWKDEDQPEEVDGELQLQAEDLLAPEEASEETMKHDDDIGEIIDEGEVEMVQQSIVEAVLGRGHEARFPGSQPVSLARSNITLLNQMQYWVTWKADGTRYLLLACEWGTYLMDRSFKVRRLPLRFICPDMKTRHHMTLLDGEMVVDEDLETGKHFRRFLAYDLLVLHNRALIGEPFEVRWTRMEETVMGPRRKERDMIEASLQASKECKLPYRYGEEAIKIRRKGFWPLPQAKKLLDEFIPQLSHECDGLIFQPAQLHYIIGTCNELLKWKFNHLNSVDFVLRITPTGEKQLELLETRRGASRPALLPGAKIDISDEDAVRWVDTVIECTYDLEQKTWKFLRERKDKETANAYHVYEKVMRSIEDNIQEEDLTSAIDTALQNKVYTERDKPSQNGRTL